MVRKNVLILSASRKTLLCRWFLKAARKYNLGVLGSDLNRNAAALSILDGIVTLPSVSEPSFISELMLHIEKNRVKLVIPTRDEDVLFLSRFVERIESSNCSVLCNSFDVTKRLVNKRSFTQFCIDELGFSNLRVINSTREARDEDFPLFFRGDKIQLPLRIKLRNKAELDAAFVLSGGGVATTFLEGEEVSVDCYVSRQGKIIYNVPRTRDIILGGESIVTTTIDSPVCNKVTEELLLKSGIRGPAVVQGMLNGDKFVPFEINLRFGGASVLSFKAACSGPELALKEYILGEELTDSGQYKNRLELFKDFKEIYRLK